MLSQQQTKINVLFHTPLFIPLIGTIIGIIIAQAGLIKISGAVILIASALLEFLTRHFFLIQHLRITQIFLCMFFIGISSVQYILQQKHQELVILNYSEKNINGQGIVIDKELLVDHRFRERLKIRIKETYNNDNQENKSVPVHTDFSISCYLPYHSELDIDDTVLLYNFTLKKSLQSPLSENQSFNNYLIKENIITTLFIDKRTKLTKIESPSFSYKRFLWHKRQQFLACFKQKLSQRSFDYFSLIFLGYKQVHKKNDLTTTFNYWGISHYLARSGLHIVLFIVIWQYFLNLLPLSFIFKNLILLLICLFYTLMSWSSLSFYRALFIFLLTQNGKLIHQQVNYAHLIIFLALTFLLFNPMNLFFLEFQLSFGLTAILVFIACVR